MPERGNDLGGFQRLTALKAEEVTPDSHVYLSCKKMVMNLHVKYLGSVRVCLPQRLKQKAAMDLGHIFFL